MEPEIFHFNESHSQRHLKHMKNTEAFGINKFQYRIVVSLGCDWVEMLLGYCGVGKTLKFIGNFEKILGNINLRIYLKSS